MKYIAVFDCDGTLIKGDATRKFLLLLRGPIELALDLCMLAPQLLSWSLRRCSTAQIKATVLNRALQAASRRRRETALSQLPATLIAQLKPQAVTRLHWHQHQGHRCLIVTASPEPLIAPLARHLEVELIATGCSDLIQVEPSRPMRLTTPNCKGPEKLRRLEHHLGFLPGPDQLESMAIARATGSCCRPVASLTGAASTARRSHIRSPRMVVGSCPFWHWHCSSSPSVEWCSWPPMQRLI